MRSWDLLDFKYMHQFYVHFLLEKSTFKLGVVDLQIIHDISLTLSFYPTQQPCPDWQQERQLLYCPTVVAHMELEFRPDQSGQRTNHFSDWIRNTESQSHTTAFDCHAMWWWHCPQCMAWHLFWHISCQNNHLSWQNARLTWNSFPTFLSSLGRNGSGGFGGVGFCQCIDFLSDKMSGRK